MFCLFHHVLILFILLDIAKFKPVIFMLLQRKNVFVEELLQLLISIVDVKLFESIRLKAQKVNICYLLTKYEERRKVNGQKT